MLVKSQPWNLKITVKTQKNFQKNTISIHLFIFNPKLKVKTLQTHTHRNTWHSKPTSTPNASQDHHTSNLSMTHHTKFNPWPTTWTTNSTTATRPTTIATTHNKIETQKPNHHNSIKPTHHHNPMRERERERERDEIKKNKSKLATCYSELLLVAVHSSTLSYFFKFSSSYIICFLVFGVLK